jgi:hypothetical protein
MVGEPAEPWLVSLPNQCLNPAFLANFGNWIPACAGMTTKTGQFEQ